MSQYTKKKQESPRDSELHEQAFINSLLLSEGEQELLDFIKTWSPFDLQFLLLQVLRMAAYSEKSAGKNEFDALFMVQQLANKIGNIQGDIWQAHIAVLRQ